MVLAFLTDQLQQLLWPMFQKAWNKHKTKKALWEEMRSIFKRFRLDSAQMLWEALCYGTKFERPIIQYDTS
jgi:hypothetical protein